MKKLLFTALGLVATSFAFSQDAVSGYYITSGGQKVVGEYQMGSFSSVSNLKFRTGAGAFTTPDAKNIQEFGVARNCKYVKYTVDVDDTAGGKPSASYAPVFKTQEVFLSVLAEGNASLYVYNDGPAPRYFIKTQSMPVPQQLVHHSYVLNGRLSENNEYRKQASEALVCGGLKGVSIVRLQYEEGSLLRYVKAYNQCAGGNTVVYDNKPGKRARLNFSAYGGVYEASFGLSGHDIPPMDDDNTLAYGLGAELELVLPSDKLAFFLRVEGENINIETEGDFPVADSPFSRRVYIYETKTALLDVFAGPRYYIKLNENNRLYIDAAASFTAALGTLNVYSYLVNDTTQYPRQREAQYHLGSAVAFSGGVGYSFNRKYAVELRTVTNRNIMSDDITLQPAKISYVQTGLTVKYTF